MRAGNEREAAAAALAEIISGGYNNLVLRKTLASPALSQSQRNFITEAVNGTLRNLIYIDYVIDNVSKTPAKRMKPLVLNTLRAAVYELLFMSGAPDYAVCSEAVNIVKNNGLAGLSGFVNGVLRNILRKKDSITFPESPGDYLSVKYSYQPWIVEEFLRELGFDETEEMFKANNRPPRLTVRVNTLKTTSAALISALAGEGVSAAPSEYVENAVTLSGSNDIAALKAFSGGLFHVMGESSMLAVNALDPKPGQDVLDLCSAPGGKAFMAAQMMNNKGRILCRDIHGHKLDLVSKSAERLGIDIIETELFDAAKTDPESKQAFDLVLADLPCTGLGIVRKKPDIKYTKKPEDVGALAALQRKILSAAAAYVRPGGTLVYSTCTLTRPENQGSADWFVQSFDFEEESRRRVLPQHMDGDGFFIAKFRKR